MVSQLQALLDRHALRIELQATRTACQYQAAGLVRLPVSQLGIKPTTSLMRVWRPDR